MNAHFIRAILAGVAMLFAVPGCAAEPASPIDWRGMTEIASGPGLKGPWQQNESRYDYVDDPAVALSPQGEAAVAWVVQARKDVFFQRLSADGTKQLAQPVNVSRNPATFSWLPRVIVAPEAPQRVFILWQEIIFSGGSHGGDILFARSDDGGATFSEPINLSSSVGGDGKGRINKEIWHNGSLDLAAGADGMLYAAWTEYDGPLWFSRSNDGGKSFSQPRQVAGGAGDLPARAPSLVLGRDRNVYMAWTTGEDVAADIRIATSTDGGATFDEPRVVAPSDGYSDAPKLAIDPRGTLHLVYAESNGGPFDHYHIRYTRSTDGARSFEAPRGISTPAPQLAESSGFPALSVDAQGNLYVIWELYPVYRAPPRGLGLVVSRNGGQQFTQPVLVPGSVDPAGGTNGSQQGRLMQKLATSGAGTVAIVNSSLKQNKRSRVWLMRGELKETS